MFELVINGLMTGFGVAIGSYLAERHFISEIRKLKTTLEPNKENPHVQVQTEPIV